MDTIRFIGHLYPRGVLLTAFAPDLDWKWEEENIYLHFRTKVNNSTVNVECDVEKYKNEYFTELHKRAFDLAKAAANLACFANGDGVTLVFEFVILPDGVPSTLRYNDPELPKYCTSYGLNFSRSFDLNAVFNLVMTDPTLFMALDDLIQTLTLHHSAEVNCGRVLDRIRRQIAQNLDGTKAWEAMGKTLNISRPYREFISKQSTGPRHGDSTFIPGEISREVVKRTWIIMDRYFEYRKRGKQPLVAPQFPELV